MTCEVKLNTLTVIHFKSGAEFIAKPSLSLVYSHCIWEHLGCQMTIVVLQCLCSSDLNLT